MRRIPPYASLTLDRFTEALASAEPVPGGGSASAVAASLAASLLSMVARLSLDRPKYAAYEVDAPRGRWTSGNGHASGSSRWPTRTRPSFGRFAAALKLPRDTDGGGAHEEGGPRDGRARLPRAFRWRPCGSATPSPNELEAMAGRSNLNAASDLDVGALLCDAAASGAGANVVINLDSVPGRGRERTDAGRVEGPARRDRCERGTDARAGRRGHAAGIPKRHDARRRAGAPRGRGRRLLAVEGTSQPAATAAPRRADRCGDLRAD